MTTQTREHLVMRNYQRYSANMVVKNPRYGLFLDMGMGKTISVLMAIDYLIDTFQVKKVLIIAPPLVAADTWSDEVEKWDATRRLKVVSLVGNPKQRKEALKQEGDIYVLSVGTFDWLVKEVGVMNWFFDMLVIDEASMFKNPDAKRTQNLRKIIARTKRFVELTGTPAPNGLLDIWTLIYMIDGGKRLGNNFYQYRSRYFLPAKSKGKRVFSWYCPKGNEVLIHEKIADVTMSLKTEDWIELPELVENVVNVTLEGKERKLYDKFKNEMLLQFDEGDITASNAAVLGGKLLQMANGAVYNENGDIQPIHKKKIEALEQIIDNANKSPMLVFYAFKHDELLIEKMLKKKKIIYGKVKNKSDREKWNRGELEVLIAHPASAGHGLNLQYGGHRVTWYGLTWSLEQWLQANKRIWRSGQKHATILNIIRAKGTFDDRVIDRLRGKKLTQDRLIEAVKAERRDIVA
ncbi:hypothetical protein UAK_02607 [Enterococcus raffinosus ATCC 49464]|uniref:Helicase ATP-binding domain-containing protein n=2 Tax=Enterococcus TaxID=1350 RepID=R2RM55_9ENTE|nr:hypothetical protein UAK_02607 [Enterococcus raffinosus ATCC 49464]EOT75727.1 hypothetical protein I590_02551 [Enterococcus raffinosus ATCC 49464]